MRTTINVDDDIIRDLMRLSDAKTKSEAINHAITEWVRRRRIDQFRHRRGTIAWEGDLETMRRIETLDSERNLG